MGQWTEKVGKLSLTTACVMDCSYKVPLKDTEGKTQERSPSAEGRATTTDLMAQ